MSTISSLASLLLLLCLGGAYAQFRPVCNGQELLRCQAAFNDAENFAADLGVQRYQDLRTAIEAEYSINPPLNYIQLCRSFKGFKTCFSNFVAYDSCVFPFGLVADANNTATGITLDQARGYSKIWTQLDFICGAVFVNEPQCIAQIFTNRTTQLNTCQSNFDNSAGRDPNQVCSYADVAKNCYAQNFVACGLVAQWYGCEYERVGTAVQYPQCTQNFCTINEAAATETRDALKMQIGAKGLEL